MRPLRYSINVTLDGCCDHRAVFADEELHRHAAVGDRAAEVATGAPLGRPIDIAGPETQDLVDMARRTFAARGEQVRLVPTWRGLFDTSMAGEVLLPGDGARLGSVTFDDWLAAGAR